MTTRTMTCTFADNLLSDAAFVNGKTYQCYREDGKVFVIDDMKFHTQVNQVAGVDGKSAWGCEQNGFYHFKLN